MSEDLLPDSPAGRQVAWYIDALNTLPDDMDFREYDTHFHPENLARWDNEPDEIRRTRWRRSQSRHGLMRLVSVESATAHSVVFIIENARGKRSSLTCTIEKDEPHRITDMRWRQVYDFGLSLRVATEADAAALADIERRAAVVIGDTSVFIDRGEDYFAGARLMEDATVIVAEVEGEPAGLAWGARHQVRVIGEERCLWHFFHLRVLPDHQRKGLWGALNEQLWEVYGEQTQGTYGLFAPDNVAWKHVSEQSGGAKDNPQVWRHPIYRAHLRTSDLKGPPAGRPATPDDASRIIEILNACHADEEMYLPFTRESWAARMNRDRSLYSWDRVWMTDNAVLGVWPAGDHMSVTVTRDGTPETWRRGHALDYGFLPGAEDEMRRLIGAWCTSLSERGLDALALFTSEGSRTRPVVMPLATDIDRWLMTTGPRIPEPDDIGERGLYVDHIYF